eukprot:gene1808-1311_t
MSVSLLRNNELVDEQNPENAPALLHHQLDPSTSQQFVPRSEFDQLSGRVKAMDTRLTAGLNRVGDEVQSLREEVRANSREVQSLREEVRADFQKVDEKLKEILTLLTGFRPCQCGVSEKQ